MSPLLRNRQSRVMSGLRQPTHQVQQLKGFSEARGGDYRKVELSRMKLAYEQPSRQFDAAPG